MTEENLNISSNEIEIDPDDLIIINDNHNWKPPKESILAYAKQLDFDIENDPPEMLSIAEKYLTKDIPDYIRRAFHKSNLQLVYINVITKEIELSSDFEELAKEEYKEAKEQLLKDMREKEKEANKATIVPRKKIAPIGAKRALEDPLKKREKEFQDEETRQLKAKIEKEEKIKDSIFNKKNGNDYNDNDSDDDIKLVDNIGNEDIDYDEKHEINSREKKFPSKNIVQNHNNN